MVLRSKKVWLSLNHTSVSCLILWSYSIFIITCIALGGKQNNVVNGAEQPPSAVAGVMQAAYAGGNAWDDASQPGNPANKGDVVDDKDHKPEPPVFGATGTAVECGILLKTSLDGISECYIEFILRGYKAERKPKTKLTMNVSTPPPKEMKHHILACSAACCAPAESPALQSFSTFVA